MLGAAGFFRLIGSPSKRTCGMSQTLVMPAKINNNEAPFRMVDRWACNQPSCCGVSFENARVIFASEPGRTDSMAGTRVIEPMKAITMPPAAMIPNAPCRRIRRDKCQEGQGRGQRAEAKRRADTSYSRNRRFLSVSTPGTLFCKPKYHMNGIIDAKPDKQHCKGH